MREAAFWLCGAALAFFVTAGAFLFLANLGTAPSDERLKPNPQPAASGAQLDLALDEDQLASLEASSQGRVGLIVSNTGDESLSEVNLTVEVSSENTALPDTRYYRDTIPNLPAGESQSVDFDLVLPARKSTGLNPDAPHQILEFRAATPEDVTAVKTAILPA